MPTIYKPKKKREYKRHGQQSFISTLYNTGLWQKLRQSQLMNEPLCQNCSKNDKLSLATCVHHKRIISGEETEEEMRNLAFDSYNLMSLCESCHILLHKIARKHNLKYIDYAKINDSINK